MQPLKLGAANGIFFSVHACSAGLQNLASLLVGPALAPRRFADHRGRLKVGLDDRASQSDAREGPETALGTTAATPQLTRKQNRSAGVNQKRYMSTTRTHGAGPMGVLRRGAEAHGKEV